MQVQIQMQVQFKSINILTDISLETYWYKIVIKLYLEYYLCTMHIS